MKTPAIHIEERRISADAPPYVIAELSANHNGKLSIAMQIIEEAKKAGADAVKLQTYTADTITLNSDAEEAAAWLSRTAPLLKRWPPSCTTCH